MSNDNPLACNFTEINEGDRKEHKENAEGVFRAVKEWREISQGYAFRVPAETDVITKAGAFIARERLCCPFFTFNLEVTSDNGPAWLTLTGDKQVKEYIKENVIPQLNISNAEEWKLPDDAIS